MIEQINVWIVTACSLGSAVVGVVSGVAIASWRLSAKNAQLETHGKMLTYHEKVIAGIVESCPQHHRELMADVKSAVCVGVKLAIQELGHEMDKKLAGHERNIAVLDERMRQAEADIKAIFIKFEWREQNHGRAEGERRRQGDMHESF
jgi:hypothetical protein